MSTLVPFATNAFSLLPYACGRAVEKLFLSMLLFYRAFIVPYYQVFIASQLSLFASD